MSSEKRKCIAFITTSTTEKPCQNEAEYGLYRNPDGEVIKSYCQLHWDNLLLKSKGQPLVRIDVSKFKDGYYFNEFQHMSQYFGGPCMNNDIKNENGNCEVLIQCDKDVDKYDNPDVAYGSSDQCRYVGKEADPKKYKPISPTFHMGMSPTSPGRRTGPPLIFPGIYNPPVPSSPFRPVSPRRSPMIFKPVSYGSTVHKAEQPLEYPTPKTTSSTYTGPSKSFEIKTDTDKMTRKDIKDYNSISDEGIITSKPYKLIRGRFDIIRKDVAPKFRITETMVLNLQELEETTDLQVALKNINFIRDSIEISNKDNSFGDSKETSEGKRWSVEETVINYIAEKFSPYISGPRLELLLSYIFDYDRRDLTKPFIFYGFTKFNKKIIAKDDINNIIYQTPYDILQVSKSKKSNTGGLGEGVYTPRDYDEDILNKSKNLNTITGCYKIGETTYGICPSGPTGPVGPSITPGATGPFGNVDIIKENKNLIDLNKDLLNQIMDIIENLKAK